jgi:hypothetical protein
MFDWRRAQQTLQEHTFLPSGVSRAARRRVPADGSDLRSRQDASSSGAAGECHAYVWDAETLCVFKMTFFRRKDLADVEAVF